MGYVAVKGGMDAIAAAEELVQHLNTDDTAPIDVRQILTQQAALVDQAMGEGSLYAPLLAALAVKQAEGDTMEAAFLLRAYRSTLPRLGYSLPMDGDEMRVRRRISSTFKDVPGGQVLGRTRDYTQRLLDFDLLGESWQLAVGSWQEESDHQPIIGRQSAALGTDSSPTADRQPPPFPKVSAWMRREGLLPPVPDAPPEAEPFDVTRESIAPPFPRSARLQMLARGETGAMTAFAYSSMRSQGFHPTIGDLRVGEVPFAIAHPLTGNPVTVGEVTVTEVEMVGTASATGAAQPGEQPAGKDGATGGRFALAYGFVFGQNERKAIAMSILDGLLMGRGTLPVHDAEFVIYHIDGVEAQGFVEHLKLPHYVTFQSSLDRMRYVQSLLAAQKEDARVAR